MKDEMKSWFQILGYEERLVPSEVSPLKMRKNRIDTYVILSIVNLEERRKILCESGVFMLFLHVRLHFADSIDKIRN